MKKAQAPAPYSFLMPVYYKENAGNFKTAIESMLAQTAKPSEIVIVCDGPLTEELDAVLDEYSAKLGEMLNIVRLPKNVGVGAASNAGLKACRNELIARMDSDDISEPDRCEAQLAAFAKDDSLAIVGGYILEFTEDPQEGFLRELPLERDDILKMARRRNPFNHVTVMFKKSKALACGGYPELPRGEDYQLLCQMLANSDNAVNLPQLMVRVRVDSDAYARRSNAAHAFSLIKVRHHLWKLGICSFIDFAVMSCAHLVLLITPGFITKYIYEKKLRKSA